MSADRESTPPHQVERECDVLARYLSGHAPSAYLRSCYARSLASLPAYGVQPDLLDLALDASARFSPSGVALADAYAALARPVTPLRHKLVLMLAILENAPETHEHFDQGIQGGRLRSTVILAASLALAGLRFAASVLVFGPIHLASTVRHVASRTR